MPTMPRLLVIDDEPLLIDAIRRMLTGEAHVTPCTSVEEAFAHLGRGESFDAILCDLHMNGRSGIEFHAELSRTTPQLAARWGSSPAARSTTRGRTSSAPTASGCWRSRSRAAPCGRCSSRSWLDAEVPAAARSSSDAATSAARQGAVRAARSRRCAGARPCGRRCAPPRRMSSAACASSRERCGSWPTSITPCPSPARPPSARRIASGSCEGLSALAISTSSRRSAAASSSAVCTARTSGLDTNRIDRLGQAGEGAGDAAHPAAALAGERPLVVGAVEPGGVLGDAVADEVEADHRDL